MAEHEATEEEEMEGGDGRQEDDEEEEGILREHPKGPAELAIAIATTKRPF